MKTLIAIPCMDMMPTGFVQSLLYLEKGNDVSVSFRANSLIYDSRNLLSLTAIEGGYDRVMWIDSDMMFTKDTMRMLMEDMDNLNAEMVTAIYFRRHSPYSPVLNKELQEPIVSPDSKITGRVRDYPDYPRDSIFPVAGCGFGCCVTSVKLLKEVWHKFGPAFAPFPWAGEDLSFCYRVNRLGHTIWCDSRISCGHIGTYVYTERNFTGRSDAD